MLHYENSSTIHSLQRVTDVMVNNRESVSWKKEKGRNPPPSPTTTQNGIEFFSRIPCNPQGCLDLEVSRHGAGVSSEKEGGN